MKPPAIATAKNGKGGSSCESSLQHSNHRVSRRLLAAQMRHCQSRCFAVPVNDIAGCYQYPPVVRYEIEEQDLSSYRRAAGFLNSSNVDIFSPQHGFGIFGGPAGSHLLALLRELKAPVVTTLHTVLLQPNADQHRVMQKLIAHSTRL